VTVILVAVLFSFAIIVWSCVSLAKSHKVRGELRTVLRKGTSTGSNNTSSHQLVECRRQELALAVADPTQIKNDMFVLEWKGKEKETRIRHHLTPRGQIVVAIRRLIANAAAKDFGSALLTDLAGSALNRAEQIFGATRIASFQNFHQVMEAQMETPSTHKFAMAVHSYSYLNASHNLLLYSMRMCCHSCVIILMLLLIGPMFLCNIKLLRHVSCNVIVIDVFP
jgi:hypothetical protein